PATTMATPATGTLTIVPATDTDTAMAARLRGPFNPLRSSLLPRLLPLRLRHRHLRLLRLRSRLHPAQRSRLLHLPRLPHPLRCPARVEWPAATRPPSRSSPRLAIRPRCRR